MESSAGAVSTKGFHQTDLIESQIPNLVGATTPGEKPEIKQATGNAPAFDASEIWKSIQPGVKAVVNGSIETANAYANQAYDRLALPILHLYDPKWSTHAAEVRLNAAVAASIKDDKVKKEIQKNVHDLENRGDKQKLTDLQISRTLDAATSLLEPESGTFKAKLPANFRQIAARGLLRNAADPDAISQGAHSTCGVASLEHKVFVRRPEIAADMVASAALRGKWTGTDGQVITIPDGSLVPGREERRFPPEDGTRNLASQLFEVTAINDIGQHVRPQMSYLQETEVNDKGQVTKEEEFWLLPGNKKRSFEEPGHGVFSTTGGLSSFLISAEATRLTGDTNAVLTNKEFDDDDCPAEFLPHPGIKDNNLTDIRTQQQLEDKLRAVKKDNQFPIQAIVWAQGVSDLSGKEADKVDDPKNKGKTNPDHAITVDDYEPALEGKKARVLVHNQWSKRYNGWMDLDKFFKCMK